MTEDNKSIISVSGRLDISVADDSFEAGRINTARLIIRNPFDVPVRIIEIVSPRSSSLQDLKSRENRTEGNGETAVAENERKPAGLLQNLEGRLSFGKSGGWFSGLINLFGLTSDIKFGAATVGKNVSILVKEKGKLTIERDLPPYQQLDIRVDPEAELIIKGKGIDLKNPAESGHLIEIAPHCEIVEYFPFQTGTWLLFKPTKVNVNVQVGYFVESKQKSQVITASLEVKPPIISMVIGTCCGAFLGTLARLLTRPTETSTQGWFLSIAGSVIMSLIATVALSRKTGTQGFITVEDFFGAFVIGTIIGYTGSSYFDSVIKAQSQGSVPPGLPGGGTNALGGTNGLGAGH